jgi:hypothetical protein
VQFVDPLARLWDGWDTTSAENHAEGNIFDACESVYGGLSVTEHQDRGLGDYRSENLE